MALGPGTMLVHYRLIEKIGEGGMGAVWKAQDTSLDRLVAVKVLPDSFAADPDRLARFEREAKLLASLNHPGIATIHGLHQDGGVRFLAMELVDGENLADRLQRGPLQLEEAIELALQVARALEAAHEQGVIHRDLKPANIQLTAGGRAKVLDFGLAKALLPGGGPEGNASLSPTVTSLGTQAGVLIGTAAYMSPEQARGRAVDRRADIWSFGLVVFEMLTGKRPFQGETISDTLAAVLIKETDLGVLPAETPRWLRRLLERCLRKEADRRLRDIGEARVMLEERSDDAAPALSLAAPVAAAPTRARRLLPWAAAALALLAAIFAGLYVRAVSRPQRIVSAAIPPPPAQKFYLNGGAPGPVQVTRDGSAVLFTAQGADGRYLIWVRRLDEGAARPIAGTEEAQYPFWSFDGRQIGFFQAGKLKKVAASGGPAIPLAEANNGKGGSWNREGKIVFAPSYNTPLHVVAAGGGEARAITTLDVGLGEDSHRLPYFLPDGTHFLYLARHGETGARSANQGHQIKVGSLAGEDSKPLLSATSHAIFASGHLLFAQQSTLLAQRFDPGSLALAGDPRPIAEGVTVLSGAAVGVFSASDEGTLAYLTGENTDLSRLYWVDLAGKEIEPAGAEAEVEIGELSPDGRQLAISIRDTASGNKDVWLQDLATGLRTRFTFDPALDDEPRWFPDGSRIVFVSDRKGSRDLYVKRVAGAGAEELLFASETDKHPAAVSPDGRRVLFAENLPSMDPDLKLLTLDGQPTVSLVAEAPGIEMWGDFSPDGNWVTYGSSETGRLEIFARYLPALDRKWQLSTEGGAMPRWGKDGSRIYFASLAGAIHDVVVRTQGDDLVIVSTHKLFPTDILAVGWSPSFELSRDETRVLVNRSASSGPHEPLTLVLNWPASLARE